MNELVSAKKRLNEMRRALENGDSSIMHAELAAATNEVARLEREQPEPSPGMARMSAAYKETDKSSAQTETLGAITPEIARELDKENLLNPTQRMKLGYLENPIKQNGE